jgi:hypothetical protein
MIGMGEIIMEEIIILAVDQWAAEVIIKGGTLYGMASTKFTTKKKH